MAMGRYSDRDDSHCHRANSSNFVMFVTIRSMPREITNDLRSSRLFSLNCDPMLSILMQYPVCIQLSAMGACQSEPSAWTTTAWVRPTQARTNGIWRASSWPSTTSFWTCRRPTTPTAESRRINSKHWKGSTSHWYGLKCQQNSINNVSSEFDLVGR